MQCYFLYIFVYIYCDFVVDQSMHTMCFAVQYGFISAWKFVNMQSINLLNQLTSWALIEAVDSSYNKLSYFEVFLLWDWTLIGHRGFLVFHWNKGQQLILIFNFRTDITFFIFILEPKSKDHFNSKPQFFLLAPLITQLRQFKMLSHIPTRKKSLFYANCGSIK